MRDFLKKISILGVVSICASLLAVGANKQWEAAEYILQQISTPSNPSSNKVKLYTKSGASLYWLNSSGTEKQVNRASDMDGIVGTANGGTGYSSFSAGEVLIGKTNGTLNKATLVGGSGISITNGDGTITVASTGGGAGASYSSSSSISNVGMSTTVAGNAITIALKQSDGSTNCDSTTPCSISFRSSAGTTGQYVTRSVTSSLTLVVSSGSTLGHQSGVSQAAYVYALDNAGTVELAVSGSFLGDEGSVTTTLAEGGAGAADGYSAMYSSTARTGVAFRLIGRFMSNEATAGTWATNSSEISVTPFKTGEVRTDNAAGAGIYWISFGGASERSQCTSSPCTIYAQSGNWVTSVTRNGTGDYTLNIVSGICTRAPVCWGADAQGLGNTSFMMTTGAAPTTTAYRLAFTNYNVPGNRDTQADVGCICPR